MKKIILGIVVVGILYLVSYLFFGGFLVGYQNSHLIIYKYNCADICPNYGYWAKKFAGKISAEQCLDIGGKPDYVTYGTFGGYDGCSPK